MNYGAMLVIWMMTLAAPNTPTSSPLATVPMKDMASCTAAIEGWMYEPGNYAMCIDQRTGRTLKGSRTMKGTS